MMTKFLSVVAIAMAIGVNAYAACTVKNSCTTSVDAAFDYNAGAPGCTASTRTCYSGGDYVYAITNCTACASGYVLAEYGVDLSWDENGCYDNYNGEITFKYCVKNDSSHPLIYYSTAAETATSQSCTYYRVDPPAPTSLNFGLVTLCMICKSGYYATNAMWHTYYTANNTSYNNGTEIQALEGECVKCPIFNNDTSASSTGSTGYFPIERCYVPKDTSWTDAAGNTMVYRDDCFYK